MAILLPLVVPLSVAMIGGMGETAADRAVLFGGIGSVLAGAIMGDHCSPISDTTVLSSTASSCDHVDHVRTQLPYALSAAGVAIVLGSVPSALGVPIWMCLIACSSGCVCRGAIVGAARRFGFVEGQTLLLPETPANTQSSAHRVNRDQGWHSMFGIADLSARTVCVA